MRDMTQADSLEIEQNFVRLRTILLLRWFAIFGQSAAIFIATYFYNLDLPLGPMGMIIALSFLSNIIATLAYPPNKRLGQIETFGIFFFDVLQLGAVLYLSGGLDNPFALFILGPVTLAGLSLELKPMAVLLVSVIAMIVFLDYSALPLVTVDGLQVMMLPLISKGLLLALVIAMIFTAFYTQRLSHEMQNLALGRLAAEMALAREQKLTDLGGIIAAAAHELNTPLATIKLTSAELIEDLSDRPDLLEDVKLINEQTNRCRDILRKMGDPKQADPNFQKIPVSELIVVAARPHQDRARRVDIHPAHELEEKDQPLISRRPEIVHGLRNLIQNAVDHAQSAVAIEYEWDEKWLWVRVMDDGKGFSSDSLDQIGEPFMGNRSRAANKAFRGLGLGLFIAKTLLERTKAQLEFVNQSPRDGGGAMVQISWQLEDLF